MHISKKERQRTGPDPPANPLPESPNGLDGCTGAGDRAAAPRRIDLTTAESHLVELPFEPRFFRTLGGRGPTLCGRVLGLDCLRTELIDARGAAEIDLD